VTPFLRRARGKPFTTSDARSASRSSGARLPSSHRRLRICGEHPADTVLAFERSRQRLIDPRAQSPPLELQGSDPRVAASSARSLVVASSVCRLVSTSWTRTDYCQLTFYREAPFAADSP